jgi:sugar O-acyltransferase (sialic acid O-acetyltransferase NeuD family)
MRQDVIVIGGGEHARVVLDAIAGMSDRWRIIGFIDAAPCEATVRQLGVPRLGDDDIGLAHARQGTSVILGVGAVSGPASRQAIARRYDSVGARWATVVHPRATVAPSAVIGDGAFVAAGAVVNVAAKIGPHSVINTGAVVEHDCVIGDHTHVGPAAAIGGGTSIGAAVHLGLGCRIRDHVRIGDGVVVGMGAVVVGDVLEGTVVGVPARRRP